MSNSEKLGVKTPSRQAEILETLESLVECRYHDSIEPIEWLAFRYGPTRPAILEEEAIEMTPEQIHSFWQQIYGRQKDKLLQKKTYLCLNEIERRDGVASVGEFRLLAFYRELVQTFASLPEASRRALVSRSWHGHFLGRSFSLDIDQLIQGFKEKEFLRQILEPVQSPETTKQPKPLIEISENKTEHLLRIGQAWLGCQQYLEEPARHLNQLIGSNLVMTHQATAQLREACTLARDQGDSHAWEALRAFADSVAENRHDNDSPFCHLRERWFYYPGEPLSS